MRERAFGLMGNVDLALAQPLDEIIGRDVDELDRVGAVEHGIRDGLAHPDAGDLRDHVVEALDVLDVHGGVDVDAVGEDFLDVEIALGVPAPRRIGVGELIDQHDLRPPRDHGVEIHLVDGVAPVRRRLARYDRQPFEEGLGFLPAVGLDDADHHIDPVLAPRARLQEHLIGLADARGGADEDAQLADARLLAPCRLQEGIRRGALLEILPLVRHRGSARLSVPSALRLR